MAIQADTLSLWTDVTTDGGVWTVIPHVTVPVGRALRYQMSASKQGQSGRSQTKQSGQVTVGADGAGTLGSLRITVGSEDRCDIVIEVFDDAKLLGDTTLHLPR